MQLQYKNTRNITHSHVRHPAGEEPGGRQTGAHQLIIGLLSLLGLRASGEHKQLNRGRPLPFAH